MITDVTLRDGIQMESRVFSLDDKVALYEALADCGFGRLEVTSFVHPKWVPQFADADEFCKRLKPRGELMVFVPNEKGLQRLLPHPIQWASAFVAASDTFNQKNVNQPVADTLAELGRMVARAHAEKRKIRIYVSTVFGCPYEGNLSDDKLFGVLDRVADLGADEVALSDTIGVGIPTQVRSIVERFSKKYPVKQTALHLHNTYGLAAGNLLAGKECGITLFDGSVGGVGGCPYAKGATGNLATEDLLFALFRAGGPKLPLDRILGVYAVLKKMGIPLRSRLADIAEKGGGVFGHG